MRVIHHKADARAKSLQLKPRPRQTSYYRHFEYSPPATDSDIVEIERFKLITNHRYSL
jgi:hypothetical protein